MKYCDILAQWNSLIDEVHSIYINSLKMQSEILACLDEKRYENKQQEQDLKNINTDCADVCAIILRNFDFD